MLDIETKNLMADGMTSSKGKTSEKKSWHYKKIMK